MKDRPDGRDQPPVKKLDISRRMMLEKQLGSQSQLAEGVGSDGERVGYRPGLGRATEEMASFVRC